MRLIKKITILGLLLTAALPAFAQLTAKEGDFSVEYLATKLTLRFDNTSARNILVTDANTSATMAIENDSRYHSYMINNLHPAQMVKVNYITTENGEPQQHSSYLITPSISSGVINVYFNHQVDTNYSQGQNAVNLANTLDDKLIETINACQATLDIAIYNSASPSAATGIAGAINAAYARGVQVRIVYDGSTSSSMIPLLNASIPRIASPNSSSYGIMHNKFVIFDANHADANKPLVWTGSTNWTVAQIDGPDRNSVITIQDQALAMVYKTEFEEMWGSTTAVPNDVAARFGPNKTDNTPHHVVVGGKIIDSYFSPTDGTNAQIVAAINSANTDIDIATMLVTRTDIRNALLNKYSAGITNINVVCDSQNPASNQFPLIQSSISPNHAVTFTDSGIMHHKFMVVDNFNHASDPLVTVGSHNWSTSAETKNDENMLIVHDAVVANQYYQAFAYLYGLAGGEIILGVKDYTQGSGWVLYPNPSKGIFTFSNTTGTVLNNATVTVSDLLGKTVYTTTDTALNAAVIDLSSQSNGMYIVNVAAGEAVLHYKVIKN